MHTYWLIQYNLLIQAYVDVRMSQCLFKIGSVLFECELLRSAEKQPQAVQLLPLADSDNRHFDVLIESLTSPAQ